VLDPAPKHAAAHEEGVDQELSVLHLDGQQTNDAIVAKLVGDTDGEDSAAFGCALLRERGAAPLYVVDIELIGSFGELGEAGEVRVVRALDLNLQAEPVMKLEKSGAFSRSRIRDRFCR